MAQKVVTGDDNFYVIIENIHVIWNNIERKLLRNTQVGKSKANLQIYRGNIHRPMEGGIQWNHHRYQE